MSKLKNVTIDELNEVDDLLKALGERYEVTMASRQRNIDALDDEMPETWSNFMYGLKKMSECFCNIQLVIMRLERKEILMLHKGSV